ncbi:MAG: twin-arginine translocase TatA/TatE family subunit [Actinomycetales bacterium]|nr:twin-arginine translocase TatA/TatE family subunit [Actinomycetales bacterium]
MTFDKLLVIGVIAIFLLGPERLPHYAAQLGRLVRSLRDMASGAKARMKDELGDDFDEVEWQKLDPRQYDPRRIIREALLDVVNPDEPAAVLKAPLKAPPISESAYVKRQERKARMAEDRALPTPFDLEST